VPFPSSPIYGSGMALWVQVADGIEITPWEEAGRKLGVLFNGAGMLDFAGSDLRFLRLHLP
jgi:hypothetical protein